MCQSSGALPRLGVLYTASGLAYAVELALPWMITTVGGRPLTRLILVVAFYAVVHGAQ